MKWPVLDEEEDDDNAALGNPWKQLCATLTTRKQIEDAAMRIIRDPDHPAWFGCWIWMAKVAFGKPRPRRVQVTLSHGEHAET